MSAFPFRKSVRCKTHNYSHPGDYFVTICVKNNLSCLGIVSRSKIYLNSYGRIVQRCWLDLPNHYANCQLSQFIVMPDHVHGIIRITHLGRHGLSEMIRGFKTFSSRGINDVGHGQIKFAWQKSFYDHIIRDAQDLIRIQLYIYNNPRDGINGLD